MREPLQRHSYGDHAYRGDMSRRNGSGTRHAARQALHFVQSALMREIFASLP
jgi:hypothetical protein